MELNVVKAIGDAILKKDAVTATQLANAGEARQSFVEIRFHDQPLPRMALLLEIVTTQRAIIWLSEADLVHEQYAKRVPHIVTLTHIYLGQSDVAIGSVHVHLNDGAQREGLGFCAFSPRVTLIPDAVFIREKGYEATRAALLKARDDSSRIYGIDSTPSFVFSGPAQQNQKAAGARPYSDFARLVQQAAG